MHVPRKFIFIGWFRQEKKKKKKKKISPNSYTANDQLIARQLIIAYPTFIMLSEINSSPYIIHVMCCRNLIHFLRQNFSIYT